MKSYRWIGFALLLLSAAIVEVSADRTVAEVELRALARALAKYYDLNGGFPKGTNSEIVRQLSDPAKGVALTPRRIDESGNVIDASGHPYVFLFSEDGWAIVARVGEWPVQIEDYISVPPREWRMRDHELLQAPSP